VKMPPANPRAARVLPRRRHSGSRRSRLSFAISSPPTPRVDTSVAILSLAAALLLSWTRSLAVLVTAQVLLALALAIIAIHASRLLNDAVPSAIRAGVSSGAGTLTWVLFLPFSLMFGWVAREDGSTVPDSCWQAPSWSSARCSS
jgi:MFS family permease